ncbi:GNAT family N-acetyltransferase [Egicoccus halophilus]|nr:GNAT family N-acetyltransferase [Egicoccus halophilus]
MMLRRLRWRRAGAGELETIVARLEQWPAEAGGAARHMFALSVIENQGVGSVRLASDDQRWAAAVVFPNRLVVPCGDASAIEEAGSPGRRWRLLIGDVAAGDAVLRHTPPDPALIVHDQRFFLVDPERVPPANVLPDPGLRRAEAADLDALARLAVQLHVDDRFGPDPGRVGWRGYRQRLEGTVRQGLAYCVGPVGAPVFKLERSVSSRRWGVQLAGIVTAPDVRGQGIARGAVAAAVRAALAEGPLRRRISLHVRADNPAAHKAYFAAGFEDREAWRLAVRS